MTEVEYDAALDAIARLMELPELTFCQRQQLDVLVADVEIYESIHYPTGGDD